MAINYHPAQGTILACDFSMLKTPEITKRRPVVVVSPNFKSRDNLCTVVPISSLLPPKVLPYHYKIFFDPLLPGPYDDESAWVLCDMLYTVCFERLRPLIIGKDDTGKRIYDARVLKKEELDAVMMCVRRGLGMEI